MGLNAKVFVLLIVATSKKLTAIAAALQQLLNEPQKIFESVAKQRFQKFFGLGLSAKRSRALVKLC